MPLSSKFKKLLLLPRRENWRKIYRLLEKRREARKYQKWIREHDVLSDADRADIRADIANFVNKPLISILMPTYNIEEKWLRACIESVLRQLYENWEFCIADDCSTKPHVRSVLEEYASSDARIKIVFRETNGHISAATNSALEIATGEFCALLDNDDEISEHALYFVAREINLFPNAAMIYSDEDMIDENNRRYEPKFKPGFSLDLLYSLNFVTHLATYRTDVLRDINGFQIGCEGSQDYDLALRFIEQIDEKQIRHIPHILYHWRAIKGSIALDSNQKSYAHERARTAIASHLARTCAKCVVKKGFAEFHRVIYDLPEKTPFASLILNAHSNDRFLSATITSLLTQTDYENFELLLITANEAVTSKYLTIYANNARVRILHSKQNSLSARLNFGAKQSKGDVLIFVESGLRIVNKNWLHEMIGCALQPKIGAVGAKLSFPNGTIRHGGYVLGLMNLIGNAHRGWAVDKVETLARHQVTGNFSAVSSACLAIRREVFDEISGFDAENLPNGLFDADLCLRIGASNRRIVWTPHAELVQIVDSATEKAVSRNSPETVYFKRRYEKILGNDFFYNPNLSLDDENFSVAIPPRFKKVWRES